MEQTNTPSPMENIPVQNTEVVLEKKKNILIPILLIVIFILVGIFAYLFFTDRVDIEDKDPSAKEEVAEDEGEEVEVEDEQIQDEEAEITTKEYINTAVGVKFEYPGNWKVEVNSEYKDLSLEISENKTSPEFIFRYLLPSGSGPEICYFSDSEIPDEVGMGTVYDNFVKIESTDTLRRTYGVYEGPEGSQQMYKVCKLDSNGIYSDWVKPGYISYFVNMSRADAQDIIKLMDGITLSFEYTGEDF